MPKYEVEIVVRQTFIGRATVYVEAADEDAAREKAEGVEIDEFEDEAVTDERSIQSVEPFEE